MISISTASLFYFCFLAAGVFLLRNNNKYRNYLFLALNIILYLFTLKSLMQLLVVVVWIAVPYFYMRMTSKLKEGAAERFHLKGLLLLFMVIVFCYLTKYDFIFESLHIPYIFAFKILGLSYFLFRQIDFIMQYEYLCEAEVKLTFTDYLNHVLSFYTLLAGPILRYEEFVTDFYEEKSALTAKEVLNCLNRAVNGYFKVYVLSGILGSLAGGWFEGLSEHSSFVTTFGAFVVFAFLNGWYIYMNFSGYCDIVIAFARLAGFTVHENFNQPYLAASVVEFWNRHHITLSEWIRDYIYSPLFKRFISGPCSNHVKAGQYISLFLTFTIAGVWHGTDLNYLVYGLFQGLGIVVATWYKAKRKKVLGKERNKAYEKNLAVLTIGRCVTWMYICMTFSFVGYDVMGWLLGK